MNVQRHFYNPSETQRAELKATALLHRQSIEKRKREAKAFKDFQELGFDEQAARELAVIHGEQQ